MPAGRQSGATSTGWKKAGLIRRTYGGAVLLEGNAVESPYLLRESENLEAKLAMAAAAARLIKNGDTLFLDSSSTVMQLCRHLSGFDGITVITNGIKTAMLLAETAKTTVYIAGGQLRKNSRSVVGVAAKEFSTRFTPILPSSPATDWTLNTD